MDIFPSFLTMLVKTVFLFTCSISIALLGQWGRQQASLFSYY